MVHPDEILCKLLYSQYNPYNASHLFGLLCNKTWSKLLRVIHSCQTAPSPYPNQCWLTISEVSWYSYDSNFRKSLRYLSVKWVLKLLIQDNSWTTHYVHMGSSHNLFPAVFLIDNSLRGHNHPIMLLDNTRSSLIYFMIYNPLTV